MKYKLESVIRLEVEADNEEAAIEVGKELLTSINDDLATAHVYEWTNPTIYTDTLEKEWQGSPDPVDPDNFWIDDKTGERVNAHTGERSPAKDAEFYGYNKFVVDGNVMGSFEVFYAGPNHDWGDLENGGEGFYWWPCYPGCMPDGDPNGPFPTAEGAFLDATGD